MFQVAKQTKVFQDVVDQIQEAILDGRIKTGELLPAERELKEMFSISRGTLREALRVLGDDGELVCTEVDNASLRFDPPQPAISEWWERFNQLQRQHGDPYVGSRLADTASALGATGVRVEPVPVISSRAEPQHRLQQLDYLRDLLLSGAETMTRRGLVDHAQREALRRVFEMVRTRPDIEFQYSAARLRCRRGG